jgi:flagellar biosynthesis protein FlhG
VTSRIGKANEAAQPGESDQARHLREMTAQSRAPEVALPALAITGGKGGVGKTCIAVNLSLALQEQGLRPLLVDCDLGLANADVLLGIAPRGTLFDVVINGHPIADALLRGPAQLPFLPAASGRDELANLQPRQLTKLLRELDGIAVDYDLIVLDTAAGIGRDVVSLLSASAVVTVVVTPEPTSIADAYALIKLLEAKTPGKDIRVIVNQAASQDEAASTFARLKRVALAYLNRDLALLGSVPRDRAVSEAVRRRQPLMLGGDCPAQQAMRSLAMRLKNQKWR